MTAPPDPPRFLGFEDAARLAGHCRWFEMRLFEVLGSWAESAADPRVKLLFRAHSFRHAWHADLWHGRLPVSGPVEAAALTVPSGDAVAALIDALGASPRSDSGVERLAAVYRVVMPHLVTVYTEHSQRAGHTAEGPTVRWLRLILADEVASWREGERLLEQLVRTPDAVERATSAQAKLEELVVQAGAIPSLVGLGSAVPATEV